MGIADDWSYVRTVHILAQTGHIKYNWCATPIVGWQLYLAALLVRLFGFSFTSVRVSTLLVGTLTAFLMQRTFVRAGISERNACFGTLVVVLSPLYMLLSVTFMTDLGGLLAIVACVYGCLRSLQAATSGAAAGWICFAVLTNGVFGTSRQIAWLGVLVMVPCTLWLLQENRRVVVLGGAATLAGWIFLVFCLHWFFQQPYTCQEHVMVKVEGLHQAIYMVRELMRALLELPFLSLALIVAFLPEIRRAGRRGWLVLSGGCVGYALLAFRTAKGHGATAMLEPLLRDWVTPQGFYQYALLDNGGPVALDFGVRVILTAVSLAGLLAVISFLLRSPKLPIREQSALQPARTPRISWKQIRYILAPFAMVYFALLIPRSKAWVLDRYLLEFVFVAALCLTRAYQEFVRPSLPGMTTALVGLTALYSIGCTHDMFAYSRARMALTNELQAAGVPDNTVDGGFEYNYSVELENGGHINDERLTNPPHSYVPIDKYRGFTCSVGPAPETWAKLTPEQRFNVEVKQETDINLPHFMPRYGIAFEPHACRGSSPFAPVSYLRWLGFRRTTLSAVRYGPR